MSGWHLFLKDANFVNLVSALDTGRMYLVQFDALIEITKRLFLAHFNDHFLDQNYSSYILHFRGNQKIARCPIEW